MVSALRSMRDSVDSYSGNAKDSYVADYTLWLSGYTTLCRITSELYVKYGILSDDSHIPEFYMYLLPIYEAQLAVEQDLTWQLVDLEPEVLPIYDCYTVTYTNCTEYELDITFYMDYETADGYITEEYTVTGIRPNQRVFIPLREMPEDCETWYIDWIVEEYYIDGVPLSDY